MYFSQAAFFLVLGNPIMGVLLGGGYSWPIEASWYSVFVFVVFLFFSFAGVKTARGTEPQGAAV